MQIQGEGSGHQVCVLPFVGEPKNLAGLRRAVSGQLNAWGVPDLIDAAELAVTELATNVLKHVGEGTPAAFLMSMDGGRLRLELHDSSPELPQLRQANCDAESGRGLALLAAISTDWGTIPTATGKAVWCALATPASAASAENYRRIQRATAAVRTYGMECNSGLPMPVLSVLALRELAVFMIADVLHAVTAQGADPDDILDRAQGHFEGRDGNLLCPSPCRDGADQL